MRGKANVRLPFKVLWISRIRVLCRLLNMMRDHNKINKHIYNSLYILAKGNRFKNKQVLLESIHKLKAVRDRERSLREKEESKNIRAGTRLKRKEAREKKKTIEKEASSASTTTES